MRIFAFRLYFIWVGYVASGKRCIQGFGRETWTKETTWKTRA